MNPTVKLVPVQQHGQELAENIYRRCSMCSKEQLIPAGQRTFSDRLCGTGLFYCNFCLRNGYYTKNNRHVLMFSLRAVIGFYHAHLHLTRKIYLSELDDIVDAHQRIGLLNPLFTYDPDTFMWFIDFSRVGSSKRKIKVEEVLKTIVNMLACFNLPHNVPGVRISKLCMKIKEAVLSFHTKRQRPKTRKMLIPTLTGCSEIEEKNAVVERSRNFLPKLMKSVDATLG